MGQSQLACGRMQSVIFSLHNLHDLLNISRFSLAFNWYLFPSLSLSPSLITNQVTTVVFDKTGTLSVGKPEVTQVIVFVSDSLCSSKLFTAIVGVAESHSEHPLGGAVVNFARRELGAGLRGECLDFQASPGRGLQCRVTGVGWGEGGEGEGRERVKRYSCVETEASLSGRQISGVGEVNVSHENQDTVAVPTQYYVKYHVL